MSYFLKSDRLSFGMWTLENQPLGFELWCDDAVTKLIGGPFNAEQIQARLDREMHNQQTYGLQYWPIFLKSSGEFIGCCGLRPRGDDRAMCELGFHLKTAFWGKGYAFEAASCVIKYAFDELHVQSVFAGHNPANNTSKQLLEKLGFQFTHEEFYEPTGLNHPSYIMSRSQM